MPAFLEAMIKVLADPRSVILTDRELWVACNSLLAPKARVGWSTFEFWKTATITDKSPESKDSITTEQAELFRQTLEMARVTQKMNLTGSMLDEKNKNQWGASWILERKFEDLKMKQGLSLGEGNTTIQITVGNKEHKGLIEDLLNGTIDIDHEEVKTLPEHE